MEDLDTLLGMLRILLVVVMLAVLALVGLNILMYLIIKRIDKNIVTRLGEKGSSEFSSIFGNGTQQGIEYPTATQVGKFKIPVLKKKKSEPGQVLGLMPKTVAEQEEEDRKKNEPDTDSFLPENFR